MESVKKLEYDSTVGGEVKINPTIATYNYAAEALAELKSLTDKVTEKPSTSAEAIIKNNKKKINVNKANKLIFQMLPLKMRRRAMSHHPKRLPQKYRAAHCAQMAKAGAPSKLKRPSRKYRRRPRNIIRYLLKYNNGDRRLETHIWHAKRFKMIKRWGYRLAYGSNNKTYRASYRAVKEHCLLQDVSYLRLIQIRGNFELLRDKLRRIVDNSQLFITANFYMSGSREGECDLFKIDKFPYGALQRVRFMWRPKNEEIDGNRTLWMWIHPSTYILVRDELVALLELQIHNTAIIPHGNKTISFVQATSNRRNHIYVHKENKCILQELTDNFNRFRLTGPLSTIIMGAVFKAVKFGFETFKWKWFQETYKNRQMTCLAYQEYFWKHINAHTSPGQLASNMILSLVVDDPRIHRPKKRTKITPADEMKLYYTYTQGNLLKINSIDDGEDGRSSGLHVRSVLWQPNKMQHLYKDILPTHAYENLRAKHVAVPGATNLQFERNTLQPLPLMLIQRPGNLVNVNNPSDYAAGWDIIVPKGYGMNVWLSLIMRGALPGGLRETDTIHRNSLNEENLADTMSALMAAGEESAKLRENYFRLPPNKRPNYRKLRVVSPFGINFSRFVYEWSIPKLSESQPLYNEFCVLRNVRILKNMRSLTFQQQRAIYDADELLENWPLLLPKFCIIQVIVRMCKRGELDDFAMICIPQKDDISKFAKNSNITIGHKVIKDTNENARAKLRSEHKMKLKRLRARRVREKRKLQKTSDKRVHIRSANTFVLCEKYWDKMCKLWLPDVPKRGPIGKKINEKFPKPVSVENSLRFQGDREVIGFVTKGGYNYTKGIATGIGYVSEKGLKELLQRDLEINYFTPMVLVRNPKHTYYRFATIDININGN